MNKRALKHVALFLVCAAVALLLGYWGAVMSLAAFAPGGDVEFSEQQKRTEATGDAMLAVFDWPSRHLLGVERSWMFSSLAFGAILYGVVLGAHRYLRKTKCAARH